MPERPELDDIAEAAATTDANAIAAASGGTPGPFVPPVPRDLVLVPAGVRAAGRPVVTGSDGGFDTTPPSVGSGGQISSIEEFRAIAADDTAALLTGLATVGSGGTLLLKDGSTYSIDPVTLAVPSALYGPGATLALKPGALETASRKCVLTITSSDVTVNCKIDANRAGQDLAAYNAAPGLSKTWYGISVKGVAAARLERVNVKATIKNAMDWGFRADFVGEGCDFDVRVQASGCGAAIYDGADCSIRARLRSLDNAGARVFPHAFDVYRCEGVDIDVRSTDHAGTGNVAGGTSLSNWVSGFTMVNTTDCTIKQARFVARDDGAMSKSVGSSFLDCQRLNCVKLSIIGYTDVLMEIGAVSWSTIGKIYLDGRYQTNTSGTACSGITCYGAGYYPDFLSRSQRVAEHTSFDDVEVRRCTGAGLTINGGRYLKFSRLRSHANRVGLYTIAQATDLTEQFYNSPAQEIDGVTFTDCDFHHNELSGADTRDHKGMRFNGCRSRNNGQANSYGTLAVTGLAATDIFTATAHGLVLNSPVSFKQITGGAGIAAANLYYARDTTADTFKVSATVGGGAVDITTDLTAGRIGGGARSDGATDPAAAGFSSVSVGNLAFTTGIVYTAPESIDDQTGTDLCSINPSIPAQISVQTPSRYNVGQVIKLTGCGAGGVDLYTRITEVDKDEITVSPAPSTFPSVSPAGTITTTGTAFVTSSAVLASYRARYWITSGANSRQLIQTDNATNGVLAAPFPANLAAAAWTVAQATVTFLPSQRYGLAQTGNAIVIGERFAGNITGAITGGAANSRARSYASGGPSQGATLPDAARLMKRTATATNYTANANDELIAVTNTAAARVITLPAIATVPDNWPLAVKDESGGAATNNITLACSGAETIEGVAAKLVNTNYGGLRVYKPTGGTVWMVAP